MFVLSFVLIAVSTAAAHVNTETLLCLSHIVETYFKENTLMLITMSGARSPLGKLTTVVNKTVVLFDERKTEISYVFRHKRYDVLVYGLRDVEILRGIFRKSSGNPRGRLAVVVDGEVSGEEAAKSVISVLWNLTREADVIVLTEEKGFVQIYSWFPYRPGECTTVTSVKVADVWRNGSFIFGRDLFPKKMSKNLNGCEVRASTRRIEPFVFEPSFPLRFVEGYEVRIVSEFAEAFNITLRYVPLDHPEYFWNYERSNHGTQGVFALLLAQEIDLAFGGMMTRQDRYELTDGLYPHMIEYLIWTYPKPGLKSNFSSIYVAFSPGLWLVIIFFHVFATGAFYVTGRASTYVEKHRRRGFSFYFFTSLAILFNTYAAKPTGSLLRFVVISYVVYALHLSAAYQSSLIVLLTHPNWDEPVKDVSELVDRGMMAYLFSSGKFLYNRTDHETWNKILSPGRQKYIDGAEMDSILHDIAFNRSSFLVFPKSCIEYLTTKFYSDKGESLFGYLNYFTYSLTIYVSPGNPLLEMFNQRLGVLTQAGIIEHWRQVIHQNEVSHAKMNSRSNDSSKGVEPLRLRHLQGAFLLWLGLLIIAVVIFVGEIFVYRIFNIRKHTD